MSFALISLVAALAQDRVDFARRVRDLDASYHTRGKALDENELAAFTAQYDAFLYFAGTNCPPKAFRCLSHAAAVAGGIEFDQAFAYRASLRLRAPAVIEVDKYTEVRVRLDSLFEVPPPDGLRGTLRLRAGDDVAAERESSADDFKEIRRAQQWNEGVLWAELFFADEKEPALREPIFVVKDLNERLKALRKGVADLKASESEETLTWQLALLDDLREGRSVETPPLFEPMLKRIEADLESMKTGDDPFAKRTGDLLRRTRDEPREVPYRIFVPSKYDPERETPLVVALHGEGGSEHTWFDAHGGGLIKRLAEARGWIVACPRGPLVADDPAYIASLVKGVSKAYKIDATRVFILGHSVGAALACRAATANPKCFRAVAAIAGGARFADLGSTPVQLVVGDHDAANEILLEAARQAPRLRDLTLDQVQGAEHFLIAGDALPKVFEFFDAHNE